VPEAPQLLAPYWLIRIAVAAVWLYEGLWCKLLGGQPHEFAVIAAVPTWGPRIGATALRLLGCLEILLAAWAISAIEPRAAATVQTVLLVLLNAGGLFWARKIIVDPGGMVVKNAAFLVLVWVCASLPAWR
jgi:hypothetical protein